MDGELHKENIRSELSGFFTQGHTEGTIANGSFEFDEGAMRGLVTDWRNLADNYSKSITSATYMSQVVGPGSDFASAGQAQAANLSGEAYVRYLQQNYDYCQQQADLFQSALDDYLDVEHKNTTEINKPGPQAGI
jgi:hypothetical protein